MGFPSYHKFSHRNIRGHITFKEGDLIKVQLTILPNYFLQLLHVILPQIARRYACAQLQYIFIYI